jgi:hypothetical protein
VYTVTVMGISSIFSSVLVSLVRLLDTIMISL